MENPYTASRDEMHRLLVISKKAQAVAKLAELSQRYPREEIERQFASQTGPITEEINASSEAFARKTENVEFVTALGLSDFYFGSEVQTDVSFEMRRNFDGGSVKTYEDLIQNIANDTHIDCAINGKGQDLIFQIKRYPQKYLEHTNESILDYLGTEVFPHYPKMDSILVVLLQPDPPYTKTNFRFPELATALNERSELIPFNEVAFTYTDASNGIMTSVLNKLYPNPEISTIPTEQMLKRFRGEA